MNTLNSISPSEWAEKSRLAELIEKMGAVARVDAEKSEKRSLQKRFAIHQGGHDTKSSKGMLAAWSRRRCTIAFKQPTRSGEEGAWRIPSSAWLADAN